MRMVIVNKHRTTSLRFDALKEDLRESETLFKAHLQPREFGTWEALSRANGDKWKDRPSFATRDVPVRDLRSNGFAKQLWSIRR